MIKEVKKPKKAMIENSLIFPGHLKGLFFVLHLYLNIIKLRFTKAKAMKMKAFARFATNSISLIAASPMARIKTRMIAKKGVCVFLCSTENIFGKEPCSAIPYTCREAVTKESKMVFAVENRAIITRSKPALLVPRAALATVARGALLVLRSSQPTMLTAASATRTYKTLVIATEYIIAFGITLSAFFVSSRNFTMLSKPINAKNTKAALLKTPENPKGISR